MNILVAEPRQELSRGAVVGPDWCSVSSRQVRLDGSSGMTEATASTNNIQTVENINSVGSLTISINRSD